MNSKLNDLKMNGKVKLPPGFRFHPTDLELALQYLKPKLESRPLPCSIIPHFDVYRADPWDLPGDKKKERYFFSTRESKYPKGNRLNRSTISGYWKATGKDKPILLRTQVAGMKKTLVFYTAKTRTDWIMHEYRLSASYEESSRDDCVLCRIFLKKRNGEDAIHGKSKTVVYDDFMTPDLNVTPSSSTSSSVTDAESSCCDSLITHL